MSDLIRKSKAMETLAEQMPALHSADGSHPADREIAIAQETYVDCIKTLDKMPTEDVPDVIHCQECKYAQVADLNDEQDGYTCQFHRGSIWFSGCYCSWGERKTE